MKKEVKLNDVEIQDFANGIVWSFMHSGLDIRGNKKKEDDLYKTVLSFFRDKKTNDHVTVTKRTLNKLHDLLCLYYGHCNVINWLALTGRYSDICMWSKRPVSQGLFDIMYDLARQEQERYIRA